MANYCSYWMKIQGKPESVEEFIKVIKCEYSYDKEEFDYIRHFWRVVDADVVERKQTDGLESVVIEGGCRWSVHLCMFDEEGTYQNDFKKDPAGYCINGDTLKSCGSDVITESKNLNLAIEIFSSDECMGFQEHYAIVNGNLLKREIYNINQLYWDKSVHSTIDELNEAYNTEYTEDMFEEAGGFVIWKFSDFSEDLIEKVS